MASTGVLFEFCGRFVVRCCNVVPHKVKSQHRRGEFNNPDRCKEDIFELERAFDGVTRVHFKNFRRSLGTM